MGTAYTTYCGRSTPGWIRVTGVTPQPGSRLAAGSVNGHAEIALAVGGAWPPYVSMGFDNACTGIYQGQLAFQAAGNVPTGRFASAPPILDMSIGATATASTGGARLSLTVATGATMTSQPQIIHAFMPTNFTTIPTWKALGLPADLVQLTTASNGDGRLEVFGIDPFSHVWHVWQNTLADADWSTGSSLGADLNSIVSFAWKTSGSIELFGTEASHDQVLHDYEYMNGPDQVVGWDYF
jgi:hypothetical protein